MKSRNRATLWPCLQKAGSQFFHGIKLTGMGSLSEEVGLVIKEGIVVFECYKKALTAQRLRPCTARFDSIKAMSSPPVLC